MPENKIFILRDRIDHSILDSLIIVARNSTEARRIAQKETCNDGWACTKSTSCNVVNTKEKRIVKRVFMRG